MSRCVSPSPPPALPTPVPSKYFKLVSSQFFSKPGRLKDSRSRGDLHGAGQEGTVPAATSQGQETLDEGQWTPVPDVSI